MDNEQPDRGGFRRCAGGVGMDPGFPWGFGCSELHDRRSVLRHLRSALRLEASLLMRLDRMARVSFMRQR